MNIINFCVPVVANVIWLHLQFRKRAATILKRHVSLDAHRVVQEILNRKIYAYCSLLFGTVVSSVSIYNIFLATIPLRYRTILLQLLVLSIVEFEIQNSIF